MRKSPLSSELLQMHWAVIAYWDFIEGRQAFTYQLSFSNQDFYVNSSPYNPSLYLRIYVGNRRGYSQKSDSYIVPVNIALFYTPDMPFTYTS